MCVCHYRLLIVVITGLIRELAVAGEMHSQPLVLLVNFDDAAAAALSIR